MRITSPSVELLGVFGNDNMVARKARKSTGREDIPSTPEATARLIKSLANEGHWTPFRHPKLEFRLTMPIFTARQWVKHQLGVDWSEISRRYTKGDVSVWVPEPGRVADPMLYMHAFSQCEIAYDRALAAGDPPEVARAILPQAMMVEVEWSASLLAVGNFLRQRLDKHAQREIRLQALEVQRLAQDKFPVSIPALIAQPWAPKGLA